MSKVKLITQRYNSLPGSGGVIDTDIRVEESYKIVGIIRTDFDIDADGSLRTSDDLSPVIHYESINNLVGKMLTLIDATSVDECQRQAQKDLFKQIAWDWYHSHTEALVYPWRKDNEEQQKLK